MKCFVMLGLSIVLSIILTIRGESAAVAVQPLTVPAGRSGQDSQVSLTTPDKNEKGGPCKDRPSAICVLV